MGDVIKIAGRIAVMVGVTALVVGLFAGLTLPTAYWGDIASNITAYVGKGKAILAYYIPVTRVIIPVALAGFSIELAIRVAMATITAVKWVLKVLE